MTIYFILSLSMVSQLAVLPLNLDSRSFMLCFCFMSSALQVMYPVREYRLPVVTCFASFSQDKVGKFHET